MKSVEDKIIEVLNELEKWKSRREKVRERYERGNADKTEMERRTNEIVRYRLLSAGLKIKSKIEKNWNAVLSLPYLLALISSGSALLETK